MTTTELKKRLLKKIDTIDNDLILEEMLRLAGVEEDLETIYHLTDKQIESVKEAQQEYERGECISGEEADKIIREWLER
jgi:hypothetical protein